MAEASSLIGLESGAWGLEQRLGGVSAMMRQLVQLDPHEEDFQMVSIKKCQNIDY